MKNEQLASEEFAVGDVAIYWRPESPYHKSEVVVRSGLWHAYVYDCVTQSEYWQMVHTIEGIFPKAPHGFWCASPTELRRKPQAVRWDQCAWQPESLNV